MIDVQPSLSYHPDSYKYQDLLVKFAGGMPLTVDQLNFLVWNEKSFNHPLMDQLVRYYLKRYHQKRDHQHSFLLPDELLTKAAIDKLKNRLAILLKEKKGKRVELQITPREFSEFKSLAYKELIFFHGNQLLTGAPFFPGGYPHVVFFQWGNAFGIAKYIVLPDEKALKSNVMIYFEDMMERSLEQCVKTYRQELDLESHPQQQLSPTAHIYEEPKAQVMYDIPRMSLNIHGSTSETRE